MRFYHGTNKYGLLETNKQGYLLHKRATKLFPNMSPCTYLAVDLEEAKQYGSVILEVDYDPMINPDKNNYQKGCWQIRVYEPIYKFKIISKTMDIKPERIYKEKFTESELLKLDAEHIFDGSSKRVRLRIQNIKSQLKKTWIKGYKYGLLNK